MSVLALLFVFGCTQDPIDDRIETAERARGTAIARQDVHAYRQLMADDLVIVDARGELVTKDDRAGAVESGVARTTHRSEETLYVRRYGDVALVMGRSIWQGGGQEQHDFFTRIWVWARNRWRMVAGHYTDITAQATDVPPRFKMLDSLVQPLPIAPGPPGRDADDQVRRAIVEQHRAYWDKDPDRYRRYAGPDLLRIAENGVRTRDELIDGMRGNAGLPAPPPEHVDVRVRIYGNVAVTTWLDVGRDLRGRPLPNRFTVVFARRDQGWQIVHIQSTGEKQP